MEVFLEYLENQSSIDKTVGLERVRRAADIVMNTLRFVGQVLKGGLGGR